ncbi:hypothetical protein IAQ61_005165 [Plenodomus lingam]|uniref:uncharacterized protein n=1 Tax=Leptosphaeria maculans TaxID=5022 RepID=UPI003333DEFA|nr:hypothetical protein IAQ61_005165 [Plenodomus lingam]
MYMNALSMLALAGAAQAHMSLFYPAPLGAAPSVNKQETELDPEFNFPLGCCGPDGGPSRPSPGPCRGHLDKFDVEDATATWTSGQEAYFQLTDFDYDPAAPGSTHFGGSCQIGFSADKGKTWKLAASYHGACPHATADGSPEAQTFDFIVPKGMPEGDYLFGWNWLNREHESFENCAKIEIKGSTPSTPSEPAQSSAAPEYPDDSSPEPQTPKEDVPVSPPASPPAGPPAVPTPIQAENPVVTTTVVKTIYAPAPTDAPAYENNQGPSGQDATHWSRRPHPEVAEGVRRYEVDGSRCECRREEPSLAVRCSCDTAPTKRNEVEHKARRLHRRTLYKRFDACDWNTAPPMETSYYTVDAKCAPNAKKNKPESDDFELKWDVSCGVVEGGSDYPLKLMECDMFGA